jgi:hypothetical protein
MRRPYPVVLLRVELVPYLVAVQHAGIKRGLVGAGYDTHQVIDRDL